MGSTQILNSRTTRNSKPATYPWWGHISRSKSPSISVYPLLFIQFLPLSVSLSTCSFHSLHTTILLRFLRYFTVHCGTERNRERESERDSSIHASWILFADRLRSRRGNLCVCCHRRRTEIYNRLTSCRQSETTGGSLRCRGGRRAAPPLRSPWRCSTMRLCLPRCSMPSPPFCASPQRSCMNVRVLPICVRPIYNPILLFISFSWFAEIFWSSSWSPPIFSCEFMNLRQRDCLIILLSLISFESILDWFLWFAKRSSCFMCFWFCFGKIILILFD